MGLAKIADKTPPSRERFVDFLRAFSIFVVVAGHWFIAFIYFSDGRIGSHNIIGVTKGLWAMTWLLQVMPLFFFVGGFANAKTLESFRKRNEPVTAFLRSRASRLLRPTMIFLTVWLPVQVFLHWIDTGGDRLIRGGMLPFAPLWFLLIYLAVVLVSPVMLSLHRRFGIWVPSAMLLVAAAVDIVAFSQNVEELRWANLAFVWLLAHQLGFFYADGTLPRAPRRVHLAMALGGLATLVLLTTFGGYPKSMIGNQVDRFSNMNPPTVCIAALMIWQIGLAMLLRPTINAWLSRPRPWSLIVGANTIVMTVYLWHMTAFLIVVLAARPFDLVPTDGGSGAWWAQRPLWILIPGLVLAGLVATFGRFERGPISRAG